MVRSGSGSRKLSYYRLGDLIGHGGMGAVYRATDARNRTAVAIKVLHEHLSEDPEKWSLFLPTGDPGPLRPPPVEPDRDSP